MTETFEPRTVHVKQLPSVSEPAPLGLFGLAVATLLLAVTYMGIVSDTDKALLMPWILFFGATTQFVAGLVEFKRNNIFGATVFTAFSMAMYSIAMTLIITSFTSVAVDMHHYAFGVIGVLIIALIATFASLLTNKLLFVILIAVDIAVVLLVGYYFWGLVGWPAGIFLLITSALSFYGAMAILVNNMAGKVIMPLGKPLWEP